METQQDATSAAGSAERDVWLLEQIRAELPPQVRARYGRLMRKRRAETLSTPEYAELLELTEQVEAWGVRRLEFLLQLSQLREVPLQTLADELLGPVTITR